MRMNFFVFLFLAFLIIPFIIISCTRSLTALIRPSPQRYTQRFEPTRPISPATNPTLTGSPTSQLDGRCDEGCCVCGEKPVGHLFVLHDRSYRLCRQHLSRAHQLIEDARRRHVNPFITLTIYDPDTIIAVAQKMSSK
jgi:hypothetical protein